MPANEPCHPLGLLVAWYLANHDSFTPSSNPRLHARKIGLIHLRARLTRSAPYFWCQAQTKPPTLKLFLSTLAFRASPRFGLIRDTSPVTCPSFSFQPAKFIFLQMAAQSPSTEGLASWAYERGSYMKPASPRLSLKHLNTPLFLALRCDTEAASIVY
jgi:hypothetical protein